jgi:hypothetical protein
VTDEDGLASPLDDNLHPSVSKLHLNCRYYVHSCPRRSSTGRPRPWPWLGHPRKRTCSPGNL